MPNKPEVPKDSILHHFPPNGHRYQEDTSSVVPSENSQQEDPTQKAPMVKSPFPIKQIFRTADMIPLYGSTVGKAALTAYGNTLGYGIEVGRGLRDRTARLLARAATNPEVSVIDTEDLNVVIGVPVEQFVNSGSTARRVREATTRILENKKYRIRKKTPPGEKARPHDPRSKSEIIPTKSAGLGSQILRRLNRNWPTGIVEFRASAIETGLKMLKKRNLDTQLAQRVASVLMPDLNMFINMRYMDRRGHMNHEVLEFSFSENSLRFNPDGSPMQPVTLIKDRFFHPALISLKDFSHILSARLLELTTGQATINPESFQKTFMLAPLADEDTRVIIEPYIYRMIAVGYINQLLTRHPGEFAGAIARTVNFTDQFGNVLSEDKAGYIATELIGGVLGLTDAPHKIGSLTYVDFVTMLNRILKDHDTYLQWAGNSKLVSAAVETARSMPELHNLIKKMGVNNPEGLDKTRKTMSAGDFFSLSLTPEILFMKAVAILEEEVGQAVVARAEAKRTLERVQTIIEIVEHTSKIDAKIWANVRGEFQKQVRNLLKEGEKTGKDFGHGVVGEIKDKYFNNPGDVIDGEIKDDNEEPPKK